jgi:ribonucleoside-diphosphate reductase alpha chain
MSVSNSKNNLPMESSNWNVVKRDGSQEAVSFDKVLRRLNKLAHSPDGKKLKVDVMELAQRVISSIYDGVETWQLDQEASQSCVSKITEHPDYGLLASRISVSNNHKITSPSFSEVTQMLWNNIDVNGVHTPLINQKYYDFVMDNKEKINSVIDYERDYKFDYFGFKTLERAYLMKVGGKLVERPQHMFMRVALSIHKDDLREGIKCYKHLADGYYIHATPTLFNMGTKREQASSCFLLNIDADSIDGIYKTIGDCAKISKFAGGIGVSVHKIRAKNSKIRGTNGTTDGLVPMLKVFNETARYVNQAGKRKGSFAVYLEPWHADIIDFLHLRRNTGTETERARDLFYSLWVPDLFMKRVEEDGDWTLMCPDKCPNLHTTYGEEFEKLYTQYESEGRGNKVMKARALWNIVLDSQIETGTPYIGYKDAVNKKNNQKNLGVIQSSNLCHEIVEFTSPDEVAVCNLASIALPRYVESVIEEDGTVKKHFNFALLREMTKMITKNLNKIIDYNFYPVPEAERSNRRHRPIGIGVQGLADVFAMLRMPFDSMEARDINRKIFENIYFAAIESSMEIARKRKKFVQEYKRIHNQRVKNADYKYSDEEQKRMEELESEHFITQDELKLPGQYAGAYSSFIGSPIHEGQLQYDMWGVEPSKEMAGEWDRLKSDIKKHGVRNSLLTALMPTASTSQILSNNECFEPYTNNIYTRRTLAGTFTVINRHLINDLLELGLWSKDMKDKIILANGSVQDIDEIPDNIKALYKTVWEIKQKALIDLSADRSPFICQTQSLNLFLKTPNYKNLSAMHFYSWKKGLKTGIYYLRSQAKTSAQKFSVDISKTNTTTGRDSKAGVQQQEEQPFVCNRDDPTCEACSA